MLLPPTTIESITVSFVFYHYILPLVLVNIAAITVYVVATYAGYEIKIELADKEREVGFYESVIQAPIVEESVFRILPAMFITATYPFLYITSSMWMVLHGPAAALLILPVLPFYVTLAANKMYVALILAHATHNLVSYAIRHLSANSY